MSEISEVTFFNNTSRISFKTKDGYFLLQFIFNQNSSTSPKEETVYIKITDMNNLRCYFTKVINNNNLIPQIKKGFEMEIIRIQVTFNF